MEETAGACSDAGPVTIQFCSDMHVELPLEARRLGEHLSECIALCEPGADPLEEGVNVLPRTGQYLGLLGDIFDGQKIRDGGYKDYLLRQCGGYEAVFVLAGNHEYYRSEYSAGRAALAALCAEVTQELGGSPQVLFLDQSRFDVPASDLRILGCTLWSSVGPESADVVGSTLSDYSAIKVARADATKTPATVDDTNAWHTRELEWLEAELESARVDGRRCVVLSHHAPSFHRTAAPQHADSAASPGFATNLERLLQPPVLAWLFGHTHFSSWQGYNVASGRWCPLSGGLDGKPKDEELAGVDSECHFGSAVLVASNQLGYGARGEHRLSRCDPRMVLVLARDGERAALRTGAG